MEPLMRLENVTRVLGGEVPVTLVRGASMEVRRGEFVSIVGPSGSGKSSLLYLLGLLDGPTEGKIFFEGRETAAMDEDARAALRLEKLGFVFQSHFLLPEFSALENVLLPMRRLGTRGPGEMRERAAGLLEDLGLKEHMRKLPRQMSGGQCQRVAIARALANDPLLVLADEPTGNLDTASSRMVQDIFVDIAGVQGRAVVAVTHETDFAARAGRTVEIVDGRIAGQWAGRRTT